MEEENTIYEPIIDNDQEYYKECLASMDKDIKSIWYTTIVPYIENYNSNYVLNKLTKDDYPKFYKFMVENNPTYNIINDNLNKLRN